jgi:hypothetical protein
MVGNSSPNPLSPKGTDYSRTKNPMQGHGQPESSESETAKQAKHDGLQQARITTKYRA